MGRLSVAFILDLVKATRHMNRELLDALIMAAIVQANIAPIVRDARLQQAYAGYDEGVPDGLRRPVSMNAVAHSLQLPYETVRRHITRLVAEGVCELGPRGAIVSAEVLESPGHRTMTLETYDRVREFYHRLRRLGELEGVQGAPARTSVHPPARLVGRVASDYVLRVLDMVTRQVGDLVGGLIFLDILRANTEGLADDDRGGPDPEPSGFVPDARRRPVRVSDLSTRLGIPDETVRRHAARLVEDDRCERTPAGLIVPARVLARPPVVQMMRDNYSSLRRMYAILAQLGVTAEWDRQAADTAVLA